MKQCYGYGEYASGRRAGVGVGKELPHYMKVESVQVVQIAIVIPHDVEDMLHIVEITFNSELV